MFPISPTRCLCRQVFFGVTVYGLFHGLVLLPVLLSLIGPDPYLPARTDIELTTSSEVKLPRSEVNGHADGSRQQQSQIGRYGGVNSAGRSSFILRITYPQSSVTPPLAGPSGRRPPGM